MFIRNVFISFITTVHTWCFGGSMTGRRWTRWQSFRRLISLHAGAEKKLYAHDWEPWPFGCCPFCRRSYGYLSSRPIPWSRYSGKTRCELLLRTWPRWIGRRSVRRWTGWRSFPQIGPVSESLRSLRCWTSPAGTRCQA